MPAKFFGTRKRIRQSKQDRQKGPLMLVLFGCENISKQQGSQICHIPTVLCINSTRWYKKIAIFGRNVRHISR
jgi:hypothetical protein